jgi:hypothetical protein
MIAAVLNSPFNFGAPPSPPPPGGDPYFASVVLLLHNDSSSFADSSGTPATVTTNLTTFESSVKKFGAGSASHRANNNYLTITDDGRFGVTTEDWTVEMWVAPDSTSGFITARRFFDSQFLRLIASGTDDVSMQVSFNNFANTTVVATSAINMTFGQWYYIAMTRSGSTFSLYIDGALIGSITNATAHNGATKNVLIGGILGNNNYSRSWIDDVRVTVGVARDVTSVPTEAFPDS